MFKKNLFLIGKIIFLILFLSTLFFTNSFAVIKETPLSKTLSPESSLPGGEKGAAKEEKINISLKINKEEFDIEDVIEVEIFLESKNKEISGNIEIDGLDNFSVISQSKIRKFSSDSLGNLFEKINVKLKLKPKKSGTFFIGPIKLNGVEKTKKYKIIVSGERLFVGNNNAGVNAFLNSSPQPSNSLSSDFEALSPESSLPFGEKGAAKKENKIEEEDKKEEKNKEIEEEKIDISDMKTIYLNEKKLYPNIFSFKSIFILLFIILLYFLFNFLKKYLIIKKNLKNNFEQKISEKKKKIDFLKLISDLELKIGDYEKEVFYHKIGNIFRMFLDEKNNKQLSNKSLKELENILNEKYFNLYKKIYYPEYSPYSDTIEERLRILEEFKKIFGK